MMYRQIIPAIVLMAVACGSPNQAIAQGGVPDIMDFQVPDLSELFERRPPMGDCPVGAREPGVRPRQHLLHLGVSEMFLNHQLRLELTDDQTAALRHRRTEARTAWMEAEAALARIERELWIMTATAPLDADAVAAKVEAIADLRARQRLDYILAVQAAAETLSGAQRARLTR